jgi:hypothetical protein
MFPQFDPSKMDPKVLMELSQLIQGLPPESLNKMQTLMHNAMAGFDVRAEMAEFERNLPAGFREKLTQLIAANPGAFAQMGGAGFGANADAGAPPPQSSIQPMSQSMSYSGAQDSDGMTIDAASASTDMDMHEARMDMHEARMTVLRGVASGQVSPEDAEKLLFGA